MVEQVNNAGGELECEICSVFRRKFDRKTGKLLRAVFGCGHALCTDCMKKYIASNVILAYLPIKCPRDGCPGKIHA